ncbi:glycosyltransferase [Vibrio diabolicus]|uniref:glycosyltransferase n=1 Tax=Vibrio diabolicus TaxID=50719 RepID=UPI0037519E00
MNVSVCMTTYNGEKYIFEQLSSIIGQLGSDDEVIICDDGSRDLTVEIINGFNDKRIKLFKNEKNLKHVKNFEKAIGLSSNEIIILSDQDDRWAADKVDFIKGFFINNTKFDYFHHNFNLMNDDGDVYDFGANKVKDSYNQLNLVSKYFSSLIKSHYYGSCLAFRRHRLDTILPFPVHTYAHDHWISICGLLEGSIYSSNRSLIDYRQHSSNVTPKNGLKFSSKLVVRMKLLLMTLVWFCRKKVDNYV